MTAVLIVLGLIAIVVGILGTIYPALPGLGLMFGGAWLLGYAGDYQGGIVGAFFSIPGLLLGPLAGAAIGEFIARKDTWQAGKVGIGTFIGFIIGTVAKIGCALTIALTILFVWLASLF